MTRHLALAAALLALAACSSGNEDPGPQTPPNLSLSLFDAPPADVTSVKLNLIALQVHVDSPAATDSASAEDPTLDTDGKWKSLPVNAIVDLVQHQGEGAALTLGNIVLPEGKITQVRLVIDTSVPNVATVSGVDCNLDLSKINANGIKVNHAFKAVEARNGDQLGLWVEFDLGQAMKKSGQCYELRPVLKVAKAVRNGADQTL